MRAYRDLFDTPADYRDHLHALRKVRPDWREPAAQDRLVNADMVDLLRMEWEYVTRASEATSVPARKLTAIFDL